MRRKLNRKRSKKRLDMTTIVAKWTIIWCLVFIMVTQNARTGHTHIHKTNLIKFTIQKPWIKWPLIEYFEMQWQCHSETILAHVQTEWMNRLQIANSNGHFESYRMSHRFSFNSSIESGIGVFYVYTFCDCVQRTMYGAKTDQNQILYLAHAAFFGWFTI